MPELHSKQLPGKVRRRRILSLVEAGGFVRVADLAQRFDISEVTVRSDLDELASRSLVERVHGGAMLPAAPVPASQHADVEPTYEESADTLIAEKEAIGQEAAALVKNRMSIILDVGTTATAVARALVEREGLADIVVFTSGITTAMALETAIPRFTVILTGGTLRPRQHSLVNPMGGNMLEQLHTDIAFIGCNGIEAVSGVSNINLPEAQIKAKMIKAAREVVVVADGTKVGRTSVARIGRTDEIDKLITSDSAPNDELAKLAEQGIDVTVVP